MSSTATVTLAEPVEVFPIASATEKITIVSPTTNSDGASLVILDVTSPSRLSVAVAPARKATIAASLEATTSPGMSTLILIDAGTVNSGATTSNATVTTVCAVPELPAASVAVKVIIVSPSGNTSDGASFDIDVIAPSTLSVAVTAAIIATISALSAATPSSSPSTISVAGASITGPVLSATVAVAVAVVVLPAASVTVNVTTVAPKGNTAGALLVIVRSVSTLSVATALSTQATTAGSVAAVPLASVAGTTPSTGAVRTGAV